MRNQRGAIALITLATVIFMMAFLLSSFIIISNRLQSQSEIKKETAKTYGVDLDNKEEIYRNYFASETASIPITTVEQLLSIGTNKEFVIDGKIYKYASDRNYILRRNLDFDVEDYREEYPNVINQTVVNGTSVYTWIGVNTLKSKNILSGKFDGQTYKIKILTEGKTVEYSSTNNFSN